MGAWSARAAHGVRYCVTVQSYSNLRMEARLTQDSMVPGATMTITATLSEYGIPVANRAAVRAEVERPDGTRTTLTLAEGDDGRFEAGIGASVEGVYRFHLKATGVTLRGLPFTRERLLTGAVFQGQQPLADWRSGERRWNGPLRVAQCLLQGRTFGRFFAEHGIDVDALRRCVERSCRRGRHLSDDEARERREGSERPDKSRRPLPPRSALKSSRCSNDSSRQGSRPRPSTQSGEVLEGAVEVP